MQGLFQYIDSKANTQEAVPRPTNFVGLGAASYVLALLYMYWKSPFTLRIIEILCRKQLQNPNVR